VKNWRVYILSCADKTLYTGITTDIKRRVKEHNEEKTGAKYTKARRPVTLVYQKIYKNRSLAAKAEAAIKAMDRTEKFKLIESK